MATNQGNHGNDQDMDQDSAGFTECTHHQMTLSYLEFGRPSHRGVETIEVPAFEEMLSSGRRIRRYAAIEQ
jgi:hypothetical protein